MAKKFIHNLLYCKYVHFKLHLVACTRMLHCCHWWKIKSVKENSRWRTLQRNSLQKYSSVCLQILMKDIFTLKQFPFLCLRSFILWMWQNMSNYRIILVDFFFHLFMLPLWNRGNPLISYRLSHRKDTRHINLAA